MCSVVASTLNSLKLQCGAPGLHLPLKVVNRRCDLLAASVLRLKRGKSQATQDPNIRDDTVRRAHRRISQRCSAQSYEVESSRVVFPTSNVESFTTGDEEETFLERLTRAWSVLFPLKLKPSSNAEIAKQRLKMILISDRCSINDEAKQMILTNIVGALSDFVEIESEENVQLNVTSDADLNTVCSVSVPVRRVRPQYQEFSNELVNAELKALDYEAFDEEGSFRMLDIRFERPDVQDAQELGIDTA